MNRSVIKSIETIFPRLVTAWILFGACVELYHIAWGTGKWLGKFSPVWFAIFFMFALFCLTLLAGMALTAWKPGALDNLSEKFIFIREHMGLVRWLVAVLVLIFPIYFLQYTLGGVIFLGAYMRPAIWVLTALLFGAIITKGEALLGWAQFLVAFLLTSSAFILAVEFIEVTSYPFSLGWSEGNRLWDYSILFGRELYLYPEDKNIPVLLDIGRQLVGGLPFLIPGVTIGVERFWVALTFVLPYILLGLAAFRASIKDKATWLLGTLWVFMFLKQGPIHPPLVLSAAATFLAWRMSLWAAIPLIVGAGYFAETSRTTWMFAPAIWIVMLEFIGASFADKKSAKTIWARSIILGAVGIFGGFLLPQYILPLFNTIQAASPIVQSEAAASAGSLSLFEIMSSIISRQPLLWYRLLPNSTYKNGILISLLIAISPLVIILAYLLAKKIWQVTRLQKLAMLLPLLVFLVIGLIASAKIGGGGDLHNLDMFLISLVLLGMLAWHNGGRDWMIKNSDAIPYALKITLVLFFTLPALSALREMYPYDMGEEIPRISILTGTRDPKMFDMRPTHETVNIALETIRGEVALAKRKGDVLFIDQRQLLTFGYVTDLPLIPEYEKKVLMNEGMSSNSAYFANFYQDLAARRFALIVSEPLRIPDEDTARQFGEENNAWVKYVSIPVLCYYEERTTLKEAGVQLLVPKDVPDDCSSLLP